MKKQIKCIECGEMYPEVFMNYPGPICDGCNELARTKQEEYKDYKQKRKK